jgi:hypothetical protein
LGIAVALLPPHGPASEATLEASVARAAEALALLAAVADSAAAVEVSTAAAVVDSTVVVADIANYKCADRKLGLRSKISALFLSLLKLL